MDEKNRLRSGSVVRALVTRIDNDEITIELGCEYIQ